MESLQQRVLLLEEMTQQYRQTIRTMEEQQSVQMKSHEALHQQFLNMMDRNPGVSIHSGRIDKTLLPGKYNGEKERWRMFSSKFINCMGKAFPILTAALEAEMGKSQPLTTERLESYKLPDEAQRCLSEQLTSLLEGDAWLAIENHQRSPSLERWRLLSCSCDPRGAYSELIDTRAVTNPTRIKGPQGIVEGINNWEGCSYGTNWRLVSLYSPTTQRNTPCSV